MTVRLPEPPLLQFRITRMLRIVLYSRRFLTTRRRTCCNRIYLRGLSSITRSTPVSQNEMVARQRFSAVAGLENPETPDRLASSEAAIHD